MAVQLSLCGCMCVQSTLELGPLCMTTPLQRQGERGKYRGQTFLLTRKGFKCKKKPALVDIHLKDGLCGSVELIPCLQLKECEINTLLFKAKRMTLILTLIPFNVWEFACTAGTESPNFLPHLFTVAFTIWSLPCSQVEL